MHRVCSTSVGVHVQESDTVVQVRLVRACDVWLACGRAGRQNARLEGQYRWHYRLIVQKMSAVENMTLTGSRRRRLALTLGGLPNKMNLFLKVKSNLNLPGKSIVYYEN